MQKLLISSLIVMLFSACAKHQPKSNIDIAKEKIEKSWENSKRWISQKYHEIVE